MSERSKRSAIDYQFEKDRVLAEKRYELRKEYDTKIKSGEIEEVSRVDKLIETAN